MNDFFLREFSISKIDLCVFVEKGKGTKHHTNIPNHRLVYIAETGEEKIYKFKNDVSLAVKSKEIIYLPKFSSYDVMSSKTGDCFAINFGLSNPDLTFPPFVLKENFAEKYSSDFKEILKLWERRKNGDINKCYSILYGIISKIQKDMTADYVPPKNKKSLLTLWNILLHIITIKACRWNFLPKYTILLLSTFVIFSNQLTRFLQNSS